MTDLPIASPMCVPCDGRIKHFTVVARFVLDIIRNNKSTKDYVKKERKE